ncbi:MAG: hypothetical protein AAB952_00860 [Patescibacteria group bacterium]
MKKFLFEFSAALVALPIIMGAAFKFAPHNWFWPITMTAAMVSAFYISYRFMRLWSRRCPRCGSLNIACKKRMFRPDGKPPVGKTLECEIIITCHNDKCPWFMLERGRDYIKVFTGFELWWRRLKGERLP